MIASDAFSRLAKPARHLGATDVRAPPPPGRRMLLPVVVHEHRRRVQMVHRQVEEPLHLVLVEVHAQHPVRPALPTTMLAINLALIATRGWSFRS